MFRLAYFDEGMPLYTYLSSISSRTILQALDDWAGSIADADPFGSPYSEVNRAGMELMLRKINRMKEKMQDATQFYTFDLFALMNEM